MKPTLVCQRITAPGSRFFGVQKAATMPLGGTGRLQIGGTVNGVLVNTSYSLGWKPQYANWTGVLFARPLDAALRCASKGLAAPYVCKGLPTH